MPRPTARLVILFADISKSTQLYEQYGDVEAERVISQALSLLTHVTESGSGRVIKTIGDEIMCTFPDVAAALEAASQMPRVFRENSSLRPYNLALKVGLHEGEVLEKEGDVFGDAVNVAARMVGLAKADQVIMTQSTLEAIPPTEVSVETRPLGHVDVRGKAAPIAIIELLWESDLGNLTKVAGTPFAPAEHRGTLVLRHGGTVRRLEAGQPVFKLGRGEHNDLHIDHDMISRNHARIEFANGVFILRDHSTNGTYLRLSGDQTTVVHRNHISLSGDGLIMPGAAGDEEAAHVIHFTCMY